MEHFRKDRKIKLLAICALVLAVAGMTLGFAAFSTTLNISSSANVTPDSDSFAVKFSTSEDSLVVEPVAPSSITSGITATNGVIQNGVSPTLTNLSANFTNPGQYVEYSLYVRNEGAYDAYLNSVNFLGEKECIASANASGDLVKSACEDIYITINFEGQTFTETTEFSGIYLAPGEAASFAVKLEYDVSGASADGEFSITFPDIAVLFSTVDDQSTVKNTPCKYTTDSNGNEMVKCGTEQFYVIEKNSETVSLFAQYNITLSTTNPVQDSSDVGVDPSKNAVNMNDILPYTAAYKNTLEEKGISVTNIGLITQEQLVILGCNGSPDSISYLCESAPDFIAGLYWLGFDEYNMSNKMISYAAPDGCSGFCGYNRPGIRPVITISASDIR